MRRVIATLALGMLCQTAIAGGACEGRAPSFEQSRLSMQMADATRSVLDQINDEVVLIARFGQDLSAFGLSYSHAAFAVRAHPSGPWSVVHKLNACGTSTSALYDEGLINFYSDTPFRYQAGIWRLAPQAQARLKVALLSDKAGAVHEPRYSLVAYPFSTRYQNSNGWVVEMLAYALAPEGKADNRIAAQSWLSVHGYRPTELDLGPMTRLGARMTKVNISFDDHPADLRWKSRIQTVTVESIVTWLRTLPNGCHDMGCPEMQVALPVSL